MSPLALRSLPSINEADELDFFRPGSPNLLGGLPEGIKREPTPFYNREEPRIVPASPTKLSPSKKRKLGSGSPLPASKKSPTPAPRLPVSVSAPVPVSVPARVSDLLSALLSEKLEQQPRPQIKSLPVLQHSRSNKENGLHFTVTRNATGARDPRRPLRRSKRGTIPPIKRMEIKEYRETLGMIEKLEQWKKARSSPDALDDDDELMDDDVGDDDRDKVC